MPTIPEKSVAVLPFIDMSEKKDQEYFSDGLSEELIDMLVKVPDLRVPARTSSFYFKGKQTTTADIARVLRVAHVLEGSVRKSGKHLRITAQLVRVDDGYHVWSQTYDRQVDDIFKVQDEIATAVVEALKVSIIGRAIVTVKGTANIEAYNLYLQAQSINRAAKSSKDMEKAANYLREALRADATFAAAWAYLANVLSVQAQAGNLKDGGILEEGRRAAERAMQLAPGLADAHTAAARIYMFNFLDFARAEPEIRKALVLEPRDSFALGMLAQYEGDRGQINRAVELTEQSVDSDPANPVRYIDLVWAFFIARRYEDAMLPYRKWLDLNPGVDHYHESLGEILLAKGEPAAGLAEMDRQSDEEARLCNDERVLAYEALRRESEAAAGLDYLEKHCAEISPYGIGRIYASLGKPDHALKWFDRAYRQRDVALMDAKVDPLFKNVQSDPRFVVLLTKMGLAD